MKSSQNKKVKKEIINTTDVVSVEDFSHERDFFLRPAG